MPLRNRLRILAVPGLALFTVSASLPPASALSPRTHHPSGGGLSAVIRYTEYGIPHIVAKDYANPGFGNGWAQAADLVCTLADGFVTLLNTSAPRVLAALADAVAELRGAGIAPDAPPGEHQSVLRGERRIPSAAVGRLWVSGTRPRACGTRR